MKKNPARDPFKEERRRTDGRVRAPVWVPGCEYAAEDARMQHQPSRITTAQPWRHTTIHRGSQQHNHGGTTPAIEDHNSTTREAHHHPSRITTAQPWRHNTIHRGSQQQGHEAIIYINRYIIVFIYLLNSIKILIYWLFYFGILVFMCIFAANLIIKQKYKDYGKRFGYLLRDARRR